MVMPSGRRNSELGPVASTSGNEPSMAESVVIMIGRKRSRQAWKIASSGASPRLRSPSMAKSTIMMPFFFTMPISMMMPMKAISERSVPNSCSASSAPRPAEGKVEMIVSGCARLSYSTPSTI